MDGRPSCPLPFFLAAAIQGCAKELASRKGQEDQNATWACSRAVALDQNHISNSSLHCIPDTRYSDIVLFHLPALNSPWKVEDQALSTRSLPSAKA